MKWGKTTVSIKETLLVLRKVLKIMVQKSPVAALFVLLFLVLEGTIPSAIIWISGRVVDLLVEVTTKEWTWDLIYWVVIFGSMFIIEQGVVAFFPYVKARLKTKTVLNLNLQMLTHLGHLPLLDIEERENQAMIKRSKNFINYRYEPFQNTLIFIGRHFFTLLFTSIILISYHWILFLIILCGALPILFIRMKHHSKIYALYCDEDPKQRLSEYYLNLLTSRDALMELRLFSLSNFLFKRHKELSKSVAKKRLDFFVKNDLRASLSDTVISNITFAGCLAVALWLIINNKISVGSFVVILQAITYAQDSMVAFIMNIGYLQQQAMYGRDYIRLLSEKGQYQSISPGAGKQACPAPPEIVLNDVTFGYPHTETPCIKHISLMIKPGETVAFVGENGSGKTTLTKIILGLYHPTSGCVTVNGTPVEEWDPESRNAAMSAIFQDFMRYEFTIKDNIIFGNCKAEENREYMEEIAQISGAAGFISNLKNGYQTTVGSLIEGSRHLSSGEWQKLAISRALFADTPFVILDEPNASLDPLSEADMFRRYKKSVTGKTAVLISHRLGSVRIADRIFVLKKGELVEQGSHEELLSKNGEYARMFALQADWYR